MDWLNAIQNLPALGWPAAIVVLTALAGMVLVRQWRRRDSREERLINEIRNAETAWRRAHQRPLDVDRLALAAKRLQNARKAAHRAGLTDAV